MFAKHSIVLALGVVLFGSPVLSKPTSDDVQNALEVFLHGRGSLEGFEYRIFEGGTGTGRIAVEGTADYFRDILRRTDRPAFFPNLDEKVKRVILKNSDVELRERDFVYGNLYETVYESGDIVEFSGNILYEEMISGYEWEFEIDESLPDGTPITELRESALIEGGTEHQRVVEKAERFIGFLKSSQNSFVETTTPEILGKRYVHRNQCTDEDRYLLTIQKEPYEIIKGDIHDLFGTRVIFDAVIDYSFDETNYSLPSIVEDGETVKIRASFTHWFDRSLGRFEVRLQRDIVQYYSSQHGGSYIDTQAPLGLVGTWQYPYYPGFANGDPGRGCVDPVFVMQR